MVQARHPGNVWMHKIADQYLRQYEAATKRHEKTRIIKMVYNHIRMEGGRFVETDRSTGVCMVASHVVAKSKISHALRYRIKKRHEVRELFSDEELESVLGPEGLLEVNPDEVSLNSLDDFSS